MLLNNIFLLCIILFGTLQGAWAASMICYDGSFNRTTEVSLNESASLLNHSCYNSSRICNGIFAFGYTGHPTNDATEAIVGALLKLNCNTMVFNWEEEASTVTTLGLLSEGISYFNTAINKTVEVGHECGESVALMAKAGMDLNKTVLIGHSLGAHVTGNAGRKLIELNMTLDRITGLEPAGPLYDKPKIGVPLNKECAKFVDCVHTDYGGYGVNTSFCDVDIYVRKTDDDVQPGCPVGDFEILSTNDTCSHNRAWALYADAVEYIGSLVGCSAANETQWLSGKGNTSDNAYIGYYTNRQARGNYYINVTNPTSRYGQYRNGIEP